MFCTAARTSSHDANATRAITLKSGCWALETFNRSPINSYELVRKMRIVPIELSDFVAIALPSVIPALPLAATVMPVGEILKGIFRLLG